LNILPLIPGPLQVVSSIEVFQSKFYMHLSFTVCVLHGSLISYF
jgi:hypothetical protein